MTSSFVRGVLFVALASPVAAHAQPAEPDPPAPSLAEAVPAPVEVPDAVRLSSPPSTAAPPPASRTASPRLVLDVELVAQARWARRAGDDLSELRLDRGELGARISLGPRAAAELRVEAIRSAVEGGALGVDGDSTVTRVRYAQVTGGHAVGPVTFDGALGFVPDPWIGALEDGYTLKPLSRSASERLLGWSASDLSALARIGVGPARLAITVGNGEGLRFPERNDGKTTTAVLGVRALDRDALRVTLSAVGRDGSLGVAAIRDRRVGGAVSAIARRARGGAEVVRAWGLGDRGEVTAWVLGGWVEGSVVDRAAARLVLAARGATLELDGGGRQATFGGALAIEPFADVTGPRPARLRIWLAVDRVTTSGDAMPLPGADPGDATLVMLLVSAAAPFSID